METNEIKIFISYSHKDEKYITEFEEYFHPIKGKYSLELWRDNENKAGEQFKQKIGDNLNQAYIVLLFVSPNFLSSDACKKEMEQSLKLREKESKIIIPIILSTCEWKETEIRDLLCVPKDGKPVTDFRDRNEAWKDISNSIKEHVKNLKHINKIEIKEDFKKFLQDAELLTKAHHNKQNILLDDIFVSPQLDCYDETREYENKYVDYQDLEKNIIKYGSIIVAGGDQSGKTTLCKRLFLALRKKDYLPIYVLDKYKKLGGNINKKIEKTFKEQYEFKNIPYSKLTNKIIPIIDNFHLAKNKQRCIESLDSYSFSVLIIDDIYGLNIKDKNIIRNFKHFKIKEFLPSLRNKLIQKWNQLTDENNKNNEDYQKLDERTELVNTTLGKITSNGIVPSYPFFILTILSAYETLTSLDENITSQGHCYQALIYIALRKEVENKDIDTYLNFLNVISYEFFKTQKKEFSRDELNNFIAKEYKEKYNLPVKRKTLLLKLNKAKLLVKDSFGNFSFHYDYLYFYFVAKYLADHIDENKKTIEDIVNNLHKNENAYITIFISHHSKSNHVLDEIVLNAMCLFDKYDAATLKKDEIKFLDEEINYIIEAALPKPDESPEHQRAEKLKRQDEIEESKNEEASDEKEEEKDPLGLEIRSSIKTVEVMGRIIKNRAGSLEKERLEEIFKNGVNVHLRLLKSFLELIKEKEFQNSIINFIKDRLEKITKESKRQLPKEILKKTAEKVFWNLSFGVLFGCIYKTIHSLGSENLTDIVKKVCDKINNPASFLIKHGILMWYSKNLQIDSIYKKTQEKEFSGTANRLMKFIISHHCAMHPINYKERQKLEQKFGFPPKQLLLLKK